MKQIKGNKQRSLITDGDLKDLATLATKSQPDADKLVWAKERQKTRYCS